MVFAEMYVPCVWIAIVSSRFEMSMGAETRKRIKTSAYESHLKAHIHCLLPTCALDRFKQNKINMQITKHNGLVALMW